MSRKHLDKYFTAQRVGQALLDKLSDVGSSIYGTVLEPCAGEGALVQLLENDARVMKVISGDIDESYPWDYQLDATDFSNAYYHLRITYLVTNPPFNVAENIIRNWYESDIRYAALLLRLSFFEPTSNKGEYDEELEEYIGRKRLWDDIGKHLKHLVVMGSPRPSFRADGKTDSVTTAWFVFDKKYISNFLITAPDWAKEGGQSDVI